MHAKFRVLALSLLAFTTYAQTQSLPITPNGAPRAANALPIYEALRASLPGAESVTVKEFALERQGAHLSFDSGSFYFYTAVSNRITGAVFVGKGRFTLAPNQPGEKRSLARLTKSDGMSQEFSTLVLRFTDGTADEIRKASTGAGPAPDDHVRSLAQEFAANYRKHMDDNLELRMLADLLGEGKGELFLASFRMGNMLTARNVLFLVDPEGTAHAAPDQVELTTWGEFGLHPWVGYTMQDASKQNLGQRVKVSDENLDITIDHSAMIKGSAVTTMKVLRDGVRVVQLNMFPTLRVAGVYSENGTPLDFVQEDKKLDPQFGIILPTTAKAGDTLRLLTVYSGKDALRDDGGNTYYLMPGARAGWYPSGPSELGDFATFHMTFHIPKPLQIVATGKQVSLTPESGGMMKAVWDSGFPIAVAGFNLGDFKTAGTKTPQGFRVDAYADVGLPDAYANLSYGAAVGSLSAVSQLKNEVAQGNAAIQIYSDFFGKLPYDHVALTEQTACNYGQSWPMLIYLPICGFWDTTAQHMLGLDPADSYWKVVTPHEVAHQWWGQLVGFNSYRDQWMSEGFAQFSAGLFLMSSSPKMDDFRDFWKQQQKLLLEKNREGVRPIDVGALTDGWRVSNEKTGNVYQALIYSKGAYILHMLEMQMWTPAGGEAAFKRSMQHFVAEYAGRAATTEDWKRSLEQTMPGDLDLRRDGTLDWFFDEYVYGTELPHYTISSELSVADGITNVHMKVSQSNVSDKFVMRVPVYLQMANGTTVRIGMVILHGSETIDKTFSLGRLPSPGKTMLLNYNADVLSD